MSEKIISTEYSEEMQKSYLDYSMSVITSRAIPDIRDGLKPVQRRVLYDMSELRINYDKPHRKSARIVGDTMGKYHPHGDSSIYDTLVVMSQEFKKGMPLVDGHGNFGSIEGDGAAAMRYTEAKLKKFTEEVYLKDLDKTVDFIANYDETEKEPEVLPVRIPNILINGAEGIAVGMTTSIPPHNLSEVCDACIAYIDNKNISIDQLLEVLQGPDFPTGGIIANKSDLKNMYMTGVGKLKVRGKIDIELGNRKSDKDKLIIAEIPYTMIGVGINKFLMDVANLIETKKLADVVDLSNQSGKDGIRIVLELKKDADIDKIKNTLYKKTRLEDTFGVNMLAIVNGRPETLNLKGILENFVNFQYSCATKKYNFLLNKEIEKKEIQEGLIIACDCIDVIIAVLRGAKSLRDAKACLISGDTKTIKFREKDKAYQKDAATLNFSERQAQAILDMRLYKLIGLEIDALLKDNAITLKNIKEYEKILKSQKNMDKVFVEDLKNIKKEYATPRRTLIEDGKEAVYDEVAIIEEEVVFITDKFGYCKIIDKSVYDKNAENIDNDYSHVKHVMNTDKLCVYTDKGYLHQIKVLDIPIGKLKDKGIPIDNISKYDGAKETILCITSALEMAKKNLIFVTEQGLIKMVAADEYVTNNKTVVSTKLGLGDKLVGVCLVTILDTDIVLASDNDYLLRFPLQEISIMKKSAKGYKAMKLGKNENITDIYMLSEVSNIKIRGRDVAINRLKEGHINGKGSKVRA